MLEGFLLVVDNAIHDIHDEQSCTPSDGLLKDVRMFLPTEPVAKLIEMPAASALSRLGGMALSGACLKVRMHTQLRLYARAFL